MSSHAPSIPEGFDVIQSQDGVIIRRKWFTWAVIPMIFFLVFWDGFLVFWYWMAFHTHGPMKILPLLFPLIHVAVGLGLTYFVISSFVNKTDVAVTFSGVRASTHPLPWPGNKYVGANEITSVVVRERYNGSNNAGNRNFRIRFAVMYVDSSNKECQLITFNTSEQAQYVANAIRTALNLESQDS